MPHPVSTSPVKKPASGLLDVAIAVALIAAVEAMRASGIPLPNPGILMFLAVLIAGYRSGVATGLLAAAVSLTYLLYFHSGGDFVPTGEQWAALTVHALVLPTAAALAGTMGAHSKRSRKLIEHLQAVEADLRASQAARELEARVKTQILDGLPANVALLDSDGVIVAVNRGWAEHVRTLGEHGAHLALGSNYNDGMFRCHQLQTASGPSPLEEILSGARSSFAAACSCPHLRGYRIEMCPVDVSGNGGAVVMHIDESERRRAQEELQQSRAVLEQAQSVAHVGSWVWEIQSGLLSWSQETMRIFGVTSEQFTGHVSLFDRQLHPDDVAAVSRAARTAIAEHTSYSHDHRIIRPDGEVRWLHERAETVYDASGDAVRMIGVVQDITERKQAEDALTESEERYRLLFELNPLPIVVFDRATLRFLAVNRAAIRHYGYSLSEFLSMTADEIRPVEERERFHSTLAEAGAVSQRHDGHYHLKKDGTILEVEVRSDPMIFQGRDSIVAVITDVTNRRHSERLLGGHNLVLGLLATGAPLEEVLSTLAQALDRQVPGIRASILLLDESGHFLQPGAFPGLPPEFMKAITPMPVGPSCNSCGTAVHLRDRVIVEDIGVDPLWEPNREAALTSGLRASWSQPILNGEGDPLGAVALYCNRSRAPNKREIKLLESSAYLAGIAIERTRAEQALTSRERMLRLQMEQMPSACLVQDQHGRIIQWNPAAERIFGWSAEETIGKNAVDLLVPPEERSQVREILGELPISERSSSRNHNFTKAGRVIICEWQNAAVQDEHGRVIGTIAMAQDVTERLAAEEALRRSEQLNRRIIENMPGGLVQVAMDGRIVKANGTAVAHLGLSYDKLTSSIVFEFGNVSIDELGNPLPPEDYPVTRCLRSNAPEGPTTIGVRRPDGTTSWGVYTAIPLHCPSGEQDGVLVTFLDITARKQAEENLRESEERLRFAQACATAGTYDWDISDRLVWSESTYELFGLEPHSGVTGTRWLSLICEADRSRIQQQIIAIAQAHQSEFRFEYRIPHPRTGTRTIATIGRCIYNEQGQAVRVAGIHIDVTELKTAQEALALSEERYRRLADHGAMGIWEVERITGDTIFANPAMCRMLEVATPEELRGSDFRSFFTPDSRRIMEQEHAKRLRGEVSTYEVELVGRRGGRRQVMITGTPVVNAERGLDSLIGTFTDITDRKAAEDALRRAQKLDAVGRLASGIAHDFNNLLTAIFGFTSLARRTLAPNHPATKSLDRVDDAARQASGVTKGLLTFTRQEQSEMKPVQLGSVVQDSVRLLRRTLPAGIELRVRVDKTPVWVRADTTQLHQVLMNLAINARDAMTSAGSITIGVDRTVAALPGTDSAAVARLTVADTGTGMSSEVLSRIFEPFFTTKPEGEGTGLGLPIIHGIVENHSGKIEVDSQEGRGTTFRILLPLSSASTQEEEPGGESTVPVGRGELVVLADDHTYVREIVTSMLLSMGFQVVQAHDGPSLADLLQTHRNSARLLILDSEMPGWSAHEGITRVREAGIAVPTLLLSGTPTDHPTSTDPDTLILRKPFQMNELADAVAQALRVAPSPSPFSGPVELA